LGNEGQPADAGGGCCCNRYRRQCRYRAERR
jgi:hypothetical protein